MIQRLRYRQVLVLLGGHNIVRDRYLTMATPEPSIDLKTIIKQQKFLHRSTYRYFLPIQTRWMDNDEYGHLNNVVYYSLFDTVINHYLIRKCGLKTDLKTSPFVGYMVDTHCTYRSAMSYPDIADCGLCIASVGRSSVQYVIGVFDESANTDNTVKSTESTSTESTANVVGYCVHVFVDPTSNKPIQLPSEFRKCLEKIVAKADS